MFLEKLSIGSKNRIYQLKDGFKIGSSSDCDITLKDELVNDIHVKIVEKNGKFYLLPLSHENLYINKKEIKAERQLKDGDEIVIGSTIFFFRENLDIEKTYDMLKIDEEILEKTTLSKKISDRGQKRESLKIDNIDNLPKLIVKSKNEEYKRPILKDEITIGSSNKCDIVLKGKNISPRHAKIFKYGKEFFLIDMESDWGTVLNSKKIVREKLKSGDRFQIGDVEIVFQNGLQKKEEVLAKQKKGISIDKKYIFTPLILIAFFILISGLIYFRLKRCSGSQKALSKIEKLIDAERFDESLNLLKKIKGCISDVKYMKIFERIKNSKRDLENFKQFEGELKKGNLNTAENILLYNVKDKKLIKSGKAILIEYYIKRAKDAFLKKDISGMIKASEKILNLERENPLGLKFLSLGKYMRKNFEEAIKISKKLLEINPHSDFSKYILLSSEYKLSKYRDVIDYIESNYETFSNKKPFLLLKAKCEIMNGNLKSAEKTLKKIISQKNPPQLAITLLNEIRGEKTQKIPSRDNLPEKILKGELKLHKKNGKFKEGKFSAFNKLFKEGMKYFNSSKKFEAAKVWLQALKLARKLNLNVKNKNVEFILKNMSDFYVERAKEFLSEKEFKNAYILIEDICFFDPYNKEANHIKNKVEVIARRYYRAGFQYLENNNYEEAKKYFKEVLDTIPEESEIYKKAEKKLELLDEM